MNKKNVIIVVLLILVVLLSVTGIALGLKFINGYEANAGKNLKTFSLDLNDMYCNVKDSNKILKVNITIETNNKDTLEILSRKVYLIRDNINQIIRNKTEEQLKGREGQTNLQKEIKETLIQIFNDETITNVYFNDFVMQ